MGPVRDKGVAAPFCGVVVHDPLRGELTAASGVLWPVLPLLPLLPPPESWCWNRDDAGVAGVDRVLAAEGVLP